MYQGQIGVISNKASWWSDIVELVDEDDLDDDGNPTVIDLADAALDVDVLVEINDQHGCNRVTASIANGKAQIVGPGLQWTLEPSDFTNLTAGTYNFILRVTIDDFVADEIIGTVAVIEGR